MNSIQIQNFIILLYIHLFYINFPMFQSPATIPTYSREWVSEMTMHMPNVLFTILFSVLFLGFLGENVLVIRGYIYLVKIPLLIKNTFSFYFVFLLLFIEQKCNILRLTMHSNQHKECQRRIHTVTTYN